LDRFVIISHPSIIALAFFGWTYHQCHKGQLPIQLHSMLRFKIHRLRWMIRMPGVVREAATNSLVMALSFATVTAGGGQREAGLGYGGMESFTFEIQAEDFGYAVITTPTSVVEDPWGVLRSGFTWLRLLHRRVIFGSAVQDI
jgi:hypothetical protein